MVGRRRPVVALFVNPGYIKKLSAQRPPKGAVLNMDAARYRKMTAYYFSVSDIGEDGLPFRGWSRYSKGVWARKKVRTPDVIYDRGVDFGHKLKRRVKRIRQEILRHALPINRELAFDKYSTHRTLREVPELADSLPDTRLFKGLSDIANMLSKHKELMLKPVWGSQGAGIMRVRKDVKGLYKLQCSNRHKIRSRLTDAALQSTLRRYIRSRRYILQEKISLLTFRGKPWDVRVLMQKDHAGKWGPVSTRVRLGDRDRFVTNTRQGARRLPAEKCLPRLLGSKSQAHELLSRIHALALRVVLSLEAVAGPLGEVGLDIAVDRSLKTWLLEANAMPTKVPMPTELSRNQPPKIYTRVMEYARFLYEQKKREALGTEPTASACSEQAEN